MSMYDIGGLPIGFSLKLSQDLEAMQYFSNLSERNKEQVVSYVQGGTTGEEAKNRVEEAVRQLHDHHSIS